MHIVETKNEYLAANTLVNQNNELQNYYELTLLQLK